MFCQLSPSLSLSLSLPLLLFAPPISISLSAAARSDRVLLVRGGDKPVTETGGGPARPYLLSERRPAFKEPQRENKSLSPL